MGTLRRPRWKHLSPEPRLLAPPLIAPPEPTWKPRPSQPLPNPPGSPSPSPHGPAPELRLLAPPLTASPQSTWKPRPLTAYSRSSGSWPRPQSGSGAVIGAVLATATPWSSTATRLLGHKGQRTAGALGEEHGRFARGRRRLSPRGRRPSPALSGLRPAGGWEGGCRTGTACLSPDRSLVSVGCGHST